MRLGLELAFIYNGVKTWLINPIKSTAEYIVDNALNLAAVILTLPIFLLIYPLQLIAGSGMFEGPAHHTNPVAKKKMREFETDFQRIKQELSFEEDKIHIAVIGGTGVGKSSLINAFRGLRGTSAERVKGLNVAHVGEKDCTKTITRYVDQRFPWIVWFDVPGAGTQDRTDTTYFQEQGLFVMDFVIVVCAGRVRGLDMNILKSAHDNEVPAILVRSKADNDLRERAKRECEDSDLEEDQVNNKMKSLKAGYVTEIKEDLMKEVQEAGLQDYVTPEDCFLVSAKHVRALMKSTKDLPALKGVDENSYQKRLEDIKQAVKQHIKKIFSAGDEIDEKRLIERVFTSIAQRRYN